MEMPEEKPAEPVPEPIVAQIPEMLAEPSEAPEIEAAEDSPVSERVVKLMAKKQERKAKKAQEKIAQEEKEEKLREEEETRRLSPGDDAKDSSDIAAIVEATSVAEALSDDMAQTASTPSMLKLDSIENDETPIENLPSLDEDIVSPSDEVLSEPEVVMAPLENEEVEEIESDNDDALVSSPAEGISTPEVCLTPRDSAPVMWSQLDSPAVSENVVDPQMIAPEGWMAVAVPIEYAPPGPFDGIWTNGLDERIEIDHSEIIFENGTRWVMQVQSMTDFAVDVGGEEFCAELDLDAQKLTWNDGDVWTMVGQTPHQKNWEASKDNTEVPCIPLWEGEPAFFPVETMPMEPISPPPMPKNMMIPEDAANWEVCWDWKKKGWCPRGDGCDWYHPMQSPTSYCQPCQADGPFCDEPAGMDYMVF